MSGLQNLLQEPWAMEPSHLSTLAAQLASPERAAAMGGMGLSPMVAHVGPVSVIPIHGTLTHRPGLESLMGMGTSVEEVRHMLRTEMADPNVKAIVLDVDSPGGTVAGIPELAAEIHAMRGRGKSITAVANTTAASAAYWLAAQADELVVTPSGSVGSIGIYAVHQEMSRHADAEGVTTTVIGIPDAKIDANEWTPLSDEARAHIESRAQTFYASFVGDVARGRGVSPDVVTAKYGGGRMLLAKPAQTAGMVDRVATLDSTVARIYKAAGGDVMAAAKRKRMYRADAAEPELLATEEDAQAISSHKTATVTGSWDGPANEARLPSGDGAAAKLRAAHAWVDPEGDPDAKASYKFIHHEVGADGSVGAANITACSAGIAVLNGGRGGTTIPDSDMAGVHAHLAAHMSSADREAPPMMSEAADLAVLEGEAERLLDEALTWEQQWDALPFAARLDAVAAEAIDLLDHARERARLRLKEDRPPFSPTNADALRSIHSASEYLLALADPEPEVAVTPEEVAPPPAPMPPPSPTTPPVNNTRLRADDAWSRYVHQEYEPWT